MLRELDMFLSLPVFRLCFLLGRRLFFVMVTWFLDYFPQHLPSVSFLEMALTLNPGCFARLGRGILLADSFALVKIEQEIVENIKIC